MEEPGKKRKEVTVTIREMEIDDINTVYHVGEGLHLLYCARDER